MVFTAIDAALSQGPLALGLSQRCTGLGSALTGSQP